MQRGLDNLNGCQSHLESKLLSVGMMLPQAPAIAYLTFGSAFLVCNWVVHALLGSPILNLEIVHENFFAQVIRLHH